MKKHIKRTHKLKPKNQGLILKQLVNQNHEIKNQKDQIHMNLISLHYYKIWNRQRTLDSVYLQKRC
jgi:hypothetical protein